MKDNLSIIDLQPGDLFTFDNGFLYLCISNDETYIMCLRKERPRHSRPGAIVKINIDPYTRVSKVLMEDVETWGDLRPGDLFHEIDWHDDLENQKIYLFVSYDSHARALILQCCKDGNCVMIIRNVVKWIRIKRLSS